MTKKQLQKEWNKIIKEAHYKPKCQSFYSPIVVRARELLLFVEVALAKIENDEKPEFYQELYKKIMPEYYRQKMLSKF